MTELGDMLETRSVDLGDMLETWSVDCLKDRAGRHVGDMVSRLT